MLDPIPLYGVICAVVGYVTGFGVALFITRPRPTPDTPEKD